MTARPSTPPLKLAPASIRRYLTLVLSVGVPLLAIPAIAGLPIEPFLLLTTYVVLLGGAIAVAHRTGPGGVRRLFRGVVHWRIGWSNWVVAVAVIPVATVAVALATGTYTAPPEGWAILVGNYLMFTLVIGALFLNVFEETAWQGLVQRHLADRHGQLRAALLTSIPFAALHLPLSLLGDVTAREAAVAAALIVVMAPAMRYVMGRTDQRTGSLLAVGITHASFNASGQLEVASGGWQHIIGLALVAAVLLVRDARRRPTQAKSAPSSRTSPGRGAGADRWSSRREGPQPTPGASQDAHEHSARGRSRLERPGLGPNRSPYAASRRTED